MSQLCIFFSFYFGVLRQNSAVQVFVIAIAIAIDDNRWTHSDSSDWIQIIWNIAFTMVFFKWDSELRSPKLPESKLRLTGTANSVLQKSLHRSEICPVWPRPLPAAWATCLAPDHMEGFHWKHFKWIYAARTTRAPQIVDFGRKFTDAISTQSLRKINWPAFSLRLSIWDSSARFNQADLWFYCTLSALIHQESLFFSRSSLVVLRNSPIGERFLPSKSLSNL